MLIGNPISDLYLKLQVFLDFKCWNEEVILLNVAGYTGKGIRVDCRTVEVPLAKNF